MVRVLIIGVGSIGERHLRCFQRTGRAELAVVEINDELRSTIAQRYGVESTFQSIAEALDWRPDAAVICTPAHLHVSMAHQLLDSGLSLLIEKPLSTSTDGVDELVKRSQQGNKLAVAYVNRSNPILRSMKAALSDGRFGAPRQLISIGGQHFPTYRPAYREIYYTRHETGGGAVQDGFTHTIDVAQWLIGPIRRLVADVAHLRLPGVEVEDTAHVMTRHVGKDSETLGSFSLNQHQAPNESTLLVVADDATLRYETHRGRWMFMTEPDTPWQMGFEQQSERDDVFVSQANAFLDFVDGQPNRLCPLDEARHAMLVCLSVLASARDQTWKTIG